MRCRSGRAWALVAVLAAVVSAARAGEDPAARAHAAMKSSFVAHGQAALSRLDQDEVQRLCTVHAPGLPPPDIAQKIMADSLATVRPPADGQYLGDWQRGELVAQTGTGFQYSDDPAKPAGGNCYACHELSGAEIAYGTIGPSLRRYGKLRGSSPPLLELAWSKLWNSNAQMPCSTMPRFGHKGILTEQQLKDLMALLFDPASPVNQ